MELVPVGTVEPPLLDPADAPKQGNERAPEAWLVFTDEVANALEGIGEEDEILVLTWLDRARREVLRVRPRDDPNNPERGCSAPAHRTGRTPSGFTGCESSRSTAGESECMPWRPWTARR